MELGLGLVVSPWRHSYQATWRTSWLVDWYSTLSREISHL